MSKILKTRDCSPVRELREIPVRVLPPRSEPSVETVSEGLAKDPAVDVAAMLESSREECRALVEQASRAAEEIVQQAESAAQAIAAQARESGYQMGYEDGRAAAADAYADLLRQGQAVVEATERQRTKLLLGMHGPLTSVCMESVRTLLERELLLHPADVETIVYELLQYVTHNAKVEVRVHPTEFDLATQAHPKWKSVKFGEWDVVIVPDLNVSPGGCEIRSEFGRVDARLETKLELLESAIASAMERSVTEDAEQFVSLANP